MMRNGIKILCIAGVVLACACKSNNGMPKDVLPLDSMKVIMWDMMQADELASQSTLKDTAHKLAYHAIGLYKEALASHHVTKEQFYKSYNYYLGRPDLNKILTDSLVNFSTRKVNPTLKPEIVKPVR